MRQKIIGSAKNKSILSTQRGFLGKKLLKVKVI